MKVIKFEWWWSYHLDAYVNLIGAGDIHASDLCEWMDEFHSHMVYTITGSVSWWWWCDS